MPKDQVQVRALGKHIIEEGRLRPGQVLWMGADRAKQMIEYKVVELVDTEETAKLESAAALDRAYKEAAKQITGRKGAMTLDYAVNGIARHFKLEKDVVKEALVRNGAATAPVGENVDTLTLANDGLRQQAAEAQALAALAGAAPTAEATAKAEAEKAAQAGNAASGSQSSEGSRDTQSTDSASSSEDGKEKQPSASPEAQASTTQASAGLFGRGKRAK